MVRIKDIAQRTRLSLMTVSRALRDLPDVAPATRARVQAAARELGYVPDVSARSLRTGSTRLVGAVLPSLADPFHARVAAGLEEALRDRGYEVIVTQSLNQPAREEAALRSLVARRVDGLLIWPAPRLASAGNPFRPLSLPAGRVVLLGPPPPFETAYPSVAGHDGAGVRAVVTHLVELGHTRIACLRGPVTSPVARERFEGFCQGLRESGLSLDDGLIFNAGATFEDGHAAALQLLHEGRRPTALIGVNDLVALGAMAGLRGQGIRVPQDVSVAGCGNVPAAAQALIPLTTVRVPKYALGVNAANLLLRLLAGEPVSPLRLPTELVVRASTARAPAPAG